MERRELDLVCVHYIRCFEIVSQLLGSNLTYEDFDDGVLTPYAILWASTREFYQTYRRMPQHLELKHVVDTRISQMHGLQDSYVSDVEVLLSSAFELPVDSLSPGYVIESGLLQRFLTHVLIDPRMRYAAMAPTEEKALILADINEVSRRATVSVVKEAKIFSEYQSYGYEAPPEPTGVSWLDSAVTGLYPGSLVGLLAWPSGGKTAAAVQIVAEAAMQGHHTAFFCYEQSIKGDVSTRFFSYVTELPRQYFEADAKIYDPEVVTRINKRKPIVEPYMHIYDMSSAIETQGRGGVAEIESAIMALKAQGSDVKYVVIDWVGSAIKSDKTLDIYADSENKKIEEFMFQLKQLTSRHNVIVIALHQLTPSAQEGKNPFFLPGQSLVHNCKSFSFLTNYMITFGLKCKLTNCFFMNVAKARNSAPTHKLLQLDAMHNRILDVENKYVANDMRSGNDDPYFNAKRQDDADDRDRKDNVAAPAGMGSLTG